jgi:hypothetical protein
MGETRDLIGIYGAVDRAAADDPEARIRVARLLPLYLDPDLRWFDDFEAWTEHKREDSTEPPFPPLEESLAGMSEREPRGRARARRLFAIAVAIQAFPELRESVLTVRAVQFETIAEGEDEAREVVELLGDERLLPEVEGDDPHALDVWWDQLREALSGLIADTAGLGPRPCAGRLVEVNLPTGPGSVATLRTEWETDQVPFDRAIRFLKPDNWPNCSDFWCQMKPLAQVSPKVYPYHEIVSTDCGHPGLAWTIEAYLDFTFVHVAGLAVTDYGLTGGHPLTGDDVLVDEGSLVVQELPANKIRITTTKRIKFNHPFGGEALAMIMCATGYASVVEDLVFSCAREGAEGTEFPGGAPGKKKKAAGAPTGPVIDEVAEEVAAAVKLCIDDCARAVQATSKKMSEGKYTANDLVRDMADMWARSAREGARAIDVGVRSARRAAGTRAREPSDG